MVEKPAFSKQKIRLVEITIHSDRVSSVKRRRTECLKGKEWRHWGEDTKLGIELMEYGLLETKINNK